MTKGLRDFPSYTENPYMDNLLYMPSRNKTVSVSYKKIPIKEFEGGKDAVAFMGIRERVDSDKFVKIFKAHIQALFGLSQSALRVLGYLMYATRISEDRIFFDKQECAKYTGYRSKNSINSGLSELLEKGFIARTLHANMFYLNPNVFFNGDRMVLMKEYIRKGSPADQAARQIEGEAA